MTGRPAPPSRALTVAARAVEAEVGLFDAGPGDEGEPEGVLVATGSPHRKRPDDAELGMVEGEDGSVPFDEEVRARLPVAAGRPDSLDVSDHGVTRPRVHHLMEQAFDSSAPGLVLGGPNQAVGLAPGDV